MKKIKNWIKLVKFIRKYRALGLPHFEILSTNNEIIICAKDHGHKDQIRLEYKEHKIKWWK